MGYLGVKWPAVLGYLAFQVYAGSRGYPCSTTPRFALYIGMYMYIHAHTQMVDVHIYTEIYNRIQMYTYIHIYICINTGVYTYIHMHIYIHIYIYMYAELADKPMLSTRVPGHASGSLQPRRSVLAGHQLTQSPYAKERSKQSFQKS